MQASPMANETVLVSPARTASSRLRSRSSTVSPVTVMPNSRGSCVARMMIETPPRKPTRIGAESRSVMKPRRANPASPMSAPTSSARVAA